MSFTPRHYQVEADRAIDDEFTRVNSTLVVMPTGTGKTEVFVTQADKEPGRTMILAQTGPLVEQAVAKVYKRTGEMPAVEMAGSYANEAAWCRSRIVVASKDSLHEKRLHCPGRFEGITKLIVDEAHHCVKTNRSYMHIVEFLRDRYPALKILGVTATAQRADKVALGGTFETCAYQYSMPQAIDDGYLVPPLANCIRVESLDLSGVDLTKSGEFNKEQLAAKLEEEGPLLEIADVMYREGAKDLKTLIFAHSVNEARALSNILSDRYHVACDWVCGDTKRCSKEERASKLSRFKAGALTCLVNCQLLTEGYDDDSIQHLGIATMYRSLSRYTQVFGRGTRPLAGLVDVPGYDAAMRRAAIAGSAKPHIKVTDLFDNSLKHKIVSVADVLGGNLDPRVVERAKDKVSAKSAAGGGEGTDVAAALAEAAAAVAVDDEAARLEAERRKKARDEADRRERDKRRHIRGEASYTAVSVNPVDELGALPLGAPLSKRGARFTFGKYSGTLIKDIPTDYLEWAAKPTVKTPYWLNKAITTELGERARFKREAAAAAAAPRNTGAPPNVGAGATPNQARVLARYGKPTNVSYAEARRLIDQINRELRTSRAPQSVS
jgi:superfamily II DNA or RNA helicase